MSKKKEIKITLTLTKEQQKATKWYTLCPWCGHKTECATTASSICPECGGNAFILPCGTIKE